MSPIAYLPRPDLVWRLPLFHCQGRPWGKVKRGHRSELIIDAVVGLLAPKETWGRYRRIAGPIAQ
jgi:hypothetical protein